MTRAQKIDLFVLSAQAIAYVRVPSINAAPTGWKRKAVSEAFAAASRAIGGALSSRDLDLARTELHHRFELE